MNRNNNIHPSKSMNRNVVSPDYFVGEIWFTPNPVTSTGVEIIELSSSHSSRSEKTLKNDSNTSHHTWSYANTNENFQSSKKETDIAGDSRQQKFRNYYPPELNKSVNNLYTHDFKSEQQSFQFDHGMNLFTITNRQVFDSDSTEYEQFDEIEVYEYDDVGVAKNISHDNNYYSNKQSKHSTHTMNNKIHPEVFQVEAPVDNDLKSVKFCDKGRVATPVPHAYVPKLDLTQKATLSTVTEITEPTKVPSASEKSSKEPPVQVKDNDEKQLSYLNWLGLSPRQQRRQKCRRTRKMQKESHENRINENKQEVFFDAVSHSCEGDVAIETHFHRNDRHKTLQAKPARTKLDESKSTNVIYKAFQTKSSRTNLLESKAHNLVNVVNKVEMKDAAVGVSPRIPVERNHTRYTEYGDAYDHTKCTQVTEEDIDRSYARFISRNSSSTDFTERQSWLRRLLICFLCYK